MSLARKTTGYVAMILGGTLGLFGAYDSNGFSRSRDVIRLEQAQVELRQAMRLDEVGAKTYERRKDLETQVDALSTPHNVQSLSRYDRDLRLSSTGILLLALGGITLLPRPGSDDEEEFE